MANKRQREARKRFREANPDLFPPQPAPSADGSKKKSKKNKKSMFKKDKKGGTGRSKHPLRVPGMRPGECCFICKSTEHVAKACPEKALWDKNKVRTH